MNAVNSIFNKVFIPPVRSSVFDLSHDVKTTGSMGELLPVNILDVMPGDSFRITPSNMLRFQPLVAPVMHRVNVGTRYFFMPNRVMWSEWDKWISGESEAEHPYVELSDGVTIVTGSLMDYLGYPTGDFVGVSIKVSIFPIVAFLSVWNEYFRDQNLQTEYVTTVVPGSNDADYLNWAIDPPPHVNWEHDYFTSSLPFAQKGDAVQIPLTTQENVPVDYTFDPLGTEAQNTGIWREASTGDPSNIGAATQAAGPTPLAAASHTAGDASAYDPNGTLSVDIQADATTLNDLRTAWTLQAFLERTARTGSRIWEVLKGQFGVTSSDARLQRPEYIGGFNQKMVISEVLSTAENTAAVVPVGQMAGHGISVGGGNVFTYRSEEHGFILGLLFVRPETSYSQGIPRMFTRFARFDYPWPLLANLGEQPVRNKEVFALSALPDGTFGYMPQYEDQRFKNSMFTGEMRNTLDFWHLGRIFGTAPVLNAAFVRCDPDTRIFAVTDPEEDHLVIHVNNKVTVSRKLPRNGIPASIS